MLQMAASLRDRSVTLKVSFSELPKRRLPRSAVGAVFVLAAASRLAHDPRGLRPSPEGVLRGFPLPAARRNPAGDGDRRAEARRQRRSPAPPGKRVCWDMGARSYRAETKLSSTPPCSRDSAAILLRFQKCDRSLRAAGESPSPKGWPGIEHVSPS